MEPMRFTVPGEPQGKARARVYFNPRIGRSVGVTPEKTDSYENLVKLMYATVSGGQPPTTEPVYLRVVAYYGIPTSTSRKKREAMLAGMIRPTKKPDFDNIGKIVADALNGIAWKDDAQVVDGGVQKWYSDRPRVKVYFDTTSWRELPFGEE